MHWTQQPMARATGGSPRPHNAQDVGWVAVLTRTPSTTS